jgi:hypothetical protein
MKGGNLTSKSAVGAYGSYSATFDPLTNYQDGVSYAANGNPDGPSYDVENRMIGSYTYDV